MTKEKNKPGEKLKELGEKLVRDIEKGKNPEISFSLRNLRN